MSAVRMVAMILASSGSIMAESMPESIIREFFCYGGK